MKRLVWILLAVFCTAIAQVQPVEPLVRQKHACCDCGGRCGMPDCAPPAPQVPSAFVGAQSVSVTRPQSARAVRPVRQAEKFFVGYAKPGVSPSVLPAPSLMASAASVPLYKAHCCFLI
jgi:hypothetical protein